jgi:hypothetical protein
MPAERDKGTPAAGSVSQDPSVTLDSNQLGIAVARLAIPICLVLAFVAQAAASAPESISLAEYIAELDRCSAVLARSGSDPAALHQLQMSLPSEWRVRAGSQQYTVAADWLKADLAKAETVHEARSGVEQAQREVQSHRQAAQALAQLIPRGSLEESKDHLNRILATKEFQALHGPTWFDSLRVRMGDWLVRHIEMLFGRIGHGRAIGNAMAWVVITLSTLLLFLWVVRATARWAAQPEIDLRGASPAGQDSHDWLREARAAAASGDYRSAVHAGYWAAVARLEETELLTVNRSRTPRESLRLIRRDSQEYPPLFELTRRFELVWYGYRSADGVDWSDVIEQLEKLGCLRSSTPAISAS